MKHTKGEWEITGESYGNYITVGNENRKTIARIPWISQTDVDNGSEEDSANAKLIAAAPDLLEALDSVMTALSPAFNFDFEMSRHEEGYEYIDKALKAIKKATE